jgi:predicted ATPase
MEKIYLKNYRGFRDQVIELQDVNFFVGENSTGKTSILKIINLLSSSQFWYDFEFNNDEVELGYFDEIISQNIDEKFIQFATEKLQLFNDNNDVIKESNIRILLEFKRVAAVPVITKIKATINKFDVLIKFSPKEIIYNYKESSGNDFSSWVKDFVFPTSKKGKFNFSIKIPTQILFNFIENEILGLADKNNFRNKFIDQKLYSDHVWIAPIRAKPKRIYESYKMNFTAEGDHIPQILRKILNSSNNKEQKKIIKILEDFGKQSNLFDKIEVKELGKKDSSPFEISVKYKNLEVKLQNVGYGVSQSLPIIIEILSSSNKCFTIQQPEVHLHPKAQAAFGTFLYNSINFDDNKFIIETHSDFTINRFRYELLKNHSGKKIKAKILFFERTDDGNIINELKLDDTGSYIDEIPESYRDFFIDEELKLLEI